MSETPRGKVAIVSVLGVAFAIVIMVWVAFNYAGHRENVAIVEAIEKPEEETPVQHLIRFWPVLLNSESAERVQWTMKSTEFPIRIELIPAKHPIDWTRCVATRDPRGDKSSVRIDAASAVRNFAKAAFAERTTNGESYWDGDGSNSVVEWQHFEQDEPHQYLYEIRFRLAR
ncbi:MAG: hypothetical protein ACK5S6_05520 [bacterium]|jgi:hypothetical protein